MTKEQTTVKDLAKSSLEIRKNLLKLCSKEAIHIGGDLSITDVMTVLWQYQMNYNPKDPDDEFRDRFILSKGHASAVVSFNQALKGCFSATDIFKEYAKDGGRFSMHSCNLINPFVEVSTGSLGHGFPVACGVALGLRLKGNKVSRVYTVLGDGELSEGSIWEAAMNAVHYSLGNIIAIIDNNGLEADGKTTDVTGLGNIEKKFRSFGWNVISLKDGNDLGQIKKTFDNLPQPDSSVPTALVCHTIKGKGVRFMENQVKWHAGKITEEQLEEALISLDYEYEKKWGKK